MKLETTESHKQFDGQVTFFTHHSETCNGPMRFAAFVPPQAKLRKLPVLYWLSGLTCTPEIFMTEAQAQAHAKKHELIIVVPDTSPRNTGIAGEDERYDLGSGAGFYVDATEPKWTRHYRMDSYVTRELRAIVEEHLPVDRSRRSISGHSMGGHGALALGLRNPDLYRSISAFAPICAPSKSHWGIQAFSEYLGSDQTCWAEYDAEALIGKSATRTPILIDQGLDDEFLKDQLFIDDFERTLKSVDYPATVRRHLGYDHSYFFISTFMDEHIAFHANHLRQ